MKRLGGLLVVGGLVAGCGSDEPAGPSASHIPYGSDAVATAKALEVCSSPRAESKLAVCEIDGDRVTVGSIRSASQQDYAVSVATTAPLCEYVGPGFIVASATGTTLQRHVDLVDLQNRYGDVTMVGDTCEL